jgi:hypothetical protein
MERSSSVVSPNSDFIWLLHNDQKDTDLLVVRVTIQGKVLPAMVLFASSDWTSEDFQRIIKSETARMPKPKDVTIGFKDDPSRSILHQCLGASTARDAKLQFCAVLPLTRGPLGGHASARSYLEPLVQLLCLSNLVEEVLDANERWCHEQCQLGRQIYGHKILCDSTKCKVGWYHKQCVQLANDYTASEWFCKDCMETGEKSRSEYDNDPFEDGILEASDQRIQCARSVDQVWKNHKWPKPTDVLNLMRSDISFEPYARNITVEYLKKKKPDTLQCWAVSRNNSQHIYPMLSPYRRSPRVRAKLLKILGFH